MKDLAKVAIGSRFQPSWFERRTPSSYEGYRAPMDWDEHKIQHALLARPQSFTQRLARAIGL